MNKRRLRRNKNIHRRMLGNRAYIQMFTMVESRGDKRLITKFIHSDPYNLNDADVRGFREYIVDESLSLGVSRI